MSEHAAINLLIVEDSQDDLDLALRALRRDGLEVQWRQVVSESAMRQALGASLPDVILSDFSLPGFSGLEALRLARELAPEVPFIFVSGTIGEERAIEAIRMGATDYVLKSNMRRLGTAVKRALSEAAGRKTYEARLQYLANYDALCALPNRSLLGDRGAQAIAHAKRAGRGCGLFALNIDRFKLLNESYGHAAGDSLLKLFAERLSAAIREGDSAARLGADAFAVLAADLGRADDAMIVARRLGECAALPFPVEGRDVHVTLSIGASLYPRDGGDFDRLLRNADAAMNRAKAAGGNAFQFYAAEMTAQAMERLELENALRVAMAQQQLELHYQPQIHIQSGNVLGVEALMRWRHPQRGPVSPAVFIPIAEQSNLIQELGIWALMEGCRQLADWHRRGHRVRLAVNVSARQFRSKGFVEAVGRALQVCQLDPSFLELELTESVLIEDRERAIAILTELKKLGVQIAVDDFGTGYSSLSYLSGLPVDCLKIDRSFVAQTTKGGRDAAIAQAIISLAHALGLRVLAEGVETAEQLEFLRRHGCDECQGYLFARPGAADTTAGLLAGGPMLPTT